MSKSRFGVTVAVPLACSDKSLNRLGQPKVSAVSTDARSPTCTLQGPCSVGVQTPMIALPGSLTLLTIPFVPGLNCRTQLIDISPVDDASPLNGERKCVGVTDTAGGTNGVDRTVGVDGVGNTEDPIGEESIDGTGGTAGTRGLNVSAEPNGTATLDGLTEETVDSMSPGDGTDVVRQLVVTTRIPSNNGTARGTHIPGNSSMSWQ